MVCLDNPVDYSKPETDALPLFRKAFRMNPSWMLLVPRLPAVGQLPKTEGLVEKILAEGPKADSSH